MTHRVTSIVTGFDQDSSPVHCDTLIRGGIVFDGSGGAGVVSDLAVDGDRIVALGDLKHWTAERTIEAAGRAVTPGFIDVHTHDDWALLSDPSLPFKTTQGVTTVIAGNCGASAAPLVPARTMPPPFSVINAAPEHCHPSVESYRKAVARIGPAVNVALLVGHASLRVSVMANDLDRQATEGESRQMQDILVQALRQGAIGLSSGLDYPPALKASADEMVALARVTGQFPGSVYSSHIRDEGDQVLEAVKEAIETGNRAGASLVISHHKCAGKANFGRSEQTLQLIDSARRDQPVALDVYPYVASSTALMTRFVRSAESVLVMWSKPHPECAGRMLHEIAAEWRRPIEAVVEQLDPAGAIYFDMDEGDLQRIMAYGPTMIGSDGLSGAERPHPRLWGTFPRVLSRYVRELKLLTLAAAVRKMTGLSADTFGLSARGYLREGFHADIVVFDPDTIRDNATFDEPEKPATGICQVMVNGELVLDQAGLSGARPGRFLARDNH